MGQGQSAGTEEQRTDLLRNIDAELTELNRVLGASRNFGSTNPELSGLEQKAGDLDAIRAQVATARTPGLLTQLKIQAAESIRHIGEAVQAAQTSLVASAGTFTGRQIAEAAYHARMTSIERNMQGIMWQDAQGFAEADAFARAHGIDGREFTGARSAFYDVSADYRSRGDRVGAVVADALNAENTADYWSQLADRTGSEEARQKAEAARKLAEEAEKEARAAVRAEVEREAADRGLSFDSPEARDAWLKSETDRRHQAKREEAIDAAVATGKMSAERGEEMKRGLAATILQERAADRAQTYDAAREVTGSHREETVIPPPQEDVADAQRQKAGAARYADLTLQPAALEQARKAAAPVAQDTENIQADAGAKIPDATPPVAKDAGKSAVVI